MLVHTAFARIRRMLKALSCACLLAPAAALAAASPVPAIPEPHHTLQLDDGSRLVAAYARYPSDVSDRYAQAVWKLRPDGTFDPAFNGTGFVAIPVWGYYESAAALALQRDGKILVAGYATDPTDPSLSQTNCYPADCGVHQTVTRLYADGTLDYTFNHNGRIALMLDGDSPQLRVEPRDDSRIDLFVQATPIGRLMPDGSVDPSAPFMYATYPTLNAQGLWRSTDPNDGPWNVAFAQQGDVLFASIQYVEQDGAPRWVVMPAGARTSASTFKGALYATRGPSRDALPSFDSSRVRASVAGQATVTLIDHDHGVVDWQIGSADHSVVQIVRSAPPISGCAWGGTSDLSRAGDYTDLWWVDPPGSESGWGLHLAQRGEFIRATWLGYDESGLPIWYQGDAPASVYVDDFRGMLVTGTQTVATFRITPIDGNQLIFSVKLGGITLEKRMTRQLFRAPGTSCR